MDEERGEIGYQTEQRCGEVGLLGLRDFKTWVRVGTMEVSRLLVLREIEIDVLKNRPRSG
jgi:hypothetical protein